MKTFKPGDKVHCLRRLGTQFTEGRIYEVASMTSTGKLNVVANDRGEKDWFWAAYFELVSEPTDEIDELIRKANEGFDALRILKGRIDHELECRHTDDGELWKHLVNLHRYEVRRKPKPAFEPFETSNGWRVELKGDRLHVGCRNFHSMAIKCSLQDLCKHSVDWVQHDHSYTFRAARSGIKSGTDILSWADADRILEALEKAGVK